MLNPLVIGKRGLSPIVLDCVPHVLSLIDFNPDCPLEVFSIVGASLLAKFFASKLAPTVGSWPNGLSGFNVGWVERSDTQQLQAMGITSFNPSYAGLFALAASLADLRTTKVVPVCSASKRAFSEARISAICSGKRVITADTALRLAAFFDTTSGFWMGLQAGYDTEEAAKELSGEPA